MTSRKIGLVLALLFLPALAHAQAFRVGRGAQIVPGSSAPTRVGTNGEIWIDSSAANVLKYTDPSGTTITLGAGGGGGTTQTIDVINATAATNKQLTAAVANSGTNVAFILNNSTTLSGTTLLLSLRNNGTEKFSVADDGSLALQGTTTGTYTLGGTVTITAPVINGLTSSGSTAINFSGNSGTWAPPTGGVTAALIPSAAYGQDSGSSANPWGNTYARHSFGRSAAAPTCTTLAGMGTGGSLACTVTGNDMHFKVTPTTGASGFGNGAFFQINFNQSWGTAPVCVLGGGRGGAQSSLVWAASIEESASTATTIQVNQNSSAAGANTAYEMNFVCGGR